MKNNKIVNLRFLAILLVVFAHSVIIYKSNWTYYNTVFKSYIFDFMDNFIYLFHMPLFFAISGFLFIKSCNQKYNFNTLIKKKAKRILIPALIIGIFWVLPIRYLCNYTPYLENNIIYNLFVNIILGLDNGHLWYCYSLFLIFCISFFIEKIKISQVKIIVVLAISLLGYFIPSWVGSGCSNLIWFYLGGYIRKNINDKYKKYYIINILLSTLCIGVFAVVYCFGIEKYRIVIELIKYVFCFSFIPLLYGLVSNHTNSLISDISDNSFGIYLFHSPLIYFTFAFIPNINPFLVFLINFGFFGLIAYILSKTIKKTKMKFILGG